MESAVQSGASFDFSSEVRNHYFKSSFARSMAFYNASQSKSLDYVLFGRETISEEGEERVSDDGCPAQCSEKEMGQRRKSYRCRSRSTDAIKQEPEPGTPRNGCDESRDDEILRLRKECQSLVEENRRLQEGSSAPVAHALLQSQVDTLQWQLKQTESSRQMYRAVMEQVSKFLERVHKNLDLVQNRSTSSKVKTRVPRSRSVHTVATSSQSRASSPSPCNIANVHRANSIAQIQDSHTYTTFRDYAWRVPRVVQEDVPPEKLSQEAFRLLRTVQSLLRTREPDLTNRLHSEPDSSGERRDTNSVGSCYSLFHSSCGRVRKSLDASSCSSRATTQLTGEEDVEGEEVDDCEEGEGAKPSRVQLSVGSTEDESGFSSMSSFHEVGLPEVGVPVFHRRWSSTPAAPFPPQQHKIQVLWV